MAADRAPRPAAAVALLAAVAGCTGLGPLPPPGGPPPCPEVVEPQGLWTCLTAGNPLPERAESAFRSTLRLLGPGRKKPDQRRRSACRSRPPPGFAAVEGLATEAGAAPLYAYHHRGAAGAPAVVVLHGLYDSRNSPYVGRIAGALAAAGFGVLVPDQRWHGCLLGDDWMAGLGVYEARDLAAWSRWLAAESGGGPVGLLGLSLGSLGAIHALADPAAPELYRAGGVAVSPPAALERLIARLDRESYLADRGLVALIDRGFRRLLRLRIEDQAIPLPPGWRRRPFAAMLEHVARTRVAAFPLAAADLLRLADPVPKIRAARRPLLLLATANDPVVGPLAAAEVTAAAAGNPLAHVIETPYGGHAGQLGLYPRWSFTLLVRFFRLAPGIPAGGGAAAAAARG